ncbi:MAG: DUF4258 domain-containing protein [Bacteroidales bacterium]|nr:DUF4258 domain-containing protein [Bacteroidales bacterium]
MFQRSITVENVKFVLLNGILVNEYPDDKPFPSKLLFAICNNRSLHVVCSENYSDNEIIVITTYEVSTDIWGNDFVTRKK